MKERKNKKNTKTIQYPLFGISFENWIQLIDLNGGIDRNYFARGAFITIGSIVMMPIRAISRLKYESATLRIAGFAYLVVSFIKTFHKYGRADL